MDELERFLPPKEEGKIFRSCPFQKECWRDIRKPIIRANKGLYLPYICSYQTEGDLEKCSHHSNYLEKESGIARDTSQGNTK